MSSLGSFKASVSTANNKLTKHCNEISPILTEPISEEANLSDEVLEMLTKQRIKLVQYETLIERDINDLETRHKNAIKYICGLSPEQKGEADEQFGSHCEMIDYIDNILVANDVLDSIEKRIALINEYVCDSTQNYVNDHRLTNSFDNKANENETPIFRCRNRKMQQRTHDLASEKLDREFDCLSVKSTPPQRFAHHNEQGDHYRERDFRRNVDDYNERYFYDKQASSPRTPMINATPCQNLRNDFPHNNYPNERTVTSELSVNIRIPEIEIQSFDGDASKFSNFWSMFRAAVHNNPRLNNLDRILQLKCLVRGEAAQIIEAIQPVAENYEFACKLLVDRYDQPAELRNILYSKIKAISRASDNTESIRKTFDRLRTLVIQLARYENCEDSIATMSLIKDKFPESIVMKVNRREYKARGSFNLSDLMATIEEITKLREATLLYSSEPKPKSTMYFEPELVTTCNAALPSSRRCFLCEKPGHIACWCRTIKSFDERRSRIRELNRCFRCLSEQHKSFECEATCPECNGNHAKVLCHRVINQIRTDKQTLSQNRSEY